jgi:hypothetical protein
VVANDNVLRRCARFTFMVHEQEHDRGLRVRVLNVKLISPPPFNHLLLVDSIVITDTIPTPIF